VKEQTPEIRAYFNEKRKLRAKELAEIKKQQAEIKKQQAEIKKQQAETAAERKAKRKSTAILRATELLRKAEAAFEPVGDERLLRIG